MNGRMEANEFLDQIWNYHRTEPKEAAKAMNFDCLFVSVDKGEKNSP